MLAQTDRRLKVVVVLRTSSSCCSTLLLTLVMSVTVIGSVYSSTATTSPCPHTCFCNTLSHIVYCSRRGLQAIPTDIAPSTVQLNLNGNMFHSPRIERQNLTTLTRLEHLYMSECAIERIVVDAFTDLTSLQWLDLSNNRIKVTHNVSYLLISSALQTGVVRFSELL